MDGKDVKDLGCLLSNFRCCNELKVSAAVSGHRCGFVYHEGPHRPASAETVYQFNLRRVAAAGAFPP